MKYNFKTMALFVGLSMLAVSCQKETFVEQDTEVEATREYISVNYSIDGVNMQATFNDETSWREFLHWLFVMAEERHRVSFGDSSRINGLTKETVTYTTKSQTDAESWGDKMIKKGYQVYISFDEKTKTYNSIAIK